MILVVSNKADIHCNPVIKHFNKNEDKFFRLNTESLLEDYDVYFETNDKSCYVVIENKKNYKKVNSEEIISIWERRPLQVNFNKLKNKKVNKVIREELNEALKWLRYFLLSKRSIGSPIWDRPNESKLNQLTHRFLKTNRKILN